MKGKSSNYWPLIALGFVWIAGVTFFFLHYFLGLCVKDILSDKGMWGDKRRYNLMVDLLYIPGSLLVTGLIFYWAGRYFFGSGNSTSDNSNLSAQLDECREQYADLLVKSSGGKIDSSSDKSSGMGAATSLAQTDTAKESNSANLAGDLKREADEADLKSDVNQAKEEAQSEMSDLDKQLEAKKQELRSDTEAKEKEVKSSLASDSSSKDSSSGKADTSSAATFDDSKAKDVFGKKIKVDDLKLVEGIGPKIASILNKYDIYTWKELAEVSPDKISEYLLTEGGAAYKIHDPSTWPKQARLAAEGKFDELKNLQDNLKGGREV